MGDVYGLTIALNCGDNDQVLAFYSRVFGRPPDTAPMDNFLEWRVAPGTWLQLSTGHDRPGANNARVRFEVDDIEAAVAGLATLAIPVGDIVEVPGVVKFANFSDDWGNALGFYQLLAPRDVVSEAQRRRDARDRAEDAEYAATREPQPATADQADGFAERGFADGEPTDTPGAGQDRVGSSGSVRDEL